MRNCDICCTPVGGQDTYFLTTKEVVTSQAYWKASLPIVAAVFTQMGLKGGVGDKLLHVVARMAKSDTPWIVCTKCFSLFEFDQTDRRRKAEEYLSTGMPADGFALCRLEYRGADLVIENIDDDAMLAALRAAVAAMQHLANPA